MPVLRGVPEIVKDRFTLVLGKAITIAGDGRRYDARRNDQGEEPGSKPGSPTKPALKRQRPHELRPSKKTRASVNTPGSRSHRHSLPKQATDETAG